MLILRKVLNSLLTGWVSFLAATLIPYALSSAEASLCRREAGRKKKESARGTSLSWPHLACVLWDELTELCFEISNFVIQCTYDLIGVSIESCCQYFSNGRRKANRKIQGKILEVSDTFNIPEKRYWPSCPGSQKVRSQNCTKASPKLDCSQSSISP